VPAEDASVGCQPYPEVLRTHNRTQAAVFEFSHKLGREETKNPPIEAVFFLLRCGGLQTTQLRPSPARENVKIFYTHEQQ
jgi:hypothetical protein